MDEHQLLQLKREWLCESGVTDSEEKLIPKELNTPWQTAFWKIKGALGSGCIFGLVGARGTGKSQLGAALTLHSIKDRGREAKKISATMLMVKLKSSIHKRDGFDMESVIHKVSNLRFLVIDEIGKSLGTEFESAIFFEILSQRYALGDSVDTILIGNGSAKQFSETVGESIISRMQERGGIIECAWPSFRNR